MMSVIIYRSLQMDDIEMTESVAIKLIELVVDPTLSDRPDHPVTTAEERNKARREFADRLIGCIHHLANLASVANEQHDISDLFATLCADKKPAPVV